MIQRGQQVSVARTYGEAERQAAELAAVRRMLHASQGCFSLSVAVCNSPALRDELIGELCQACPEIRVIALPQETGDVFALAVAETGDPPPAGLFLVNLEASLPSDRADHPVLRSLNASRELWPRHFPCPVVFWLPEYAATILSTHARDFWRYRSHGFEFVSESMASAAVMEQGSQDDFLAAGNLSVQAKRFRIAELEQRIREARCPPPESMLRHVAHWRNELGFLEWMSGRPDRAMSIWQECLRMLHQIGDVQGTAATLNNMAWVVTHQGDVARAMALWQESFRLQEQIGDVKGKAATLNNIAGIVAHQGDVARAMALWQESLNLAEHIGHVQGKAATLNNMAWVAAQQGDVVRAMALWQDSLKLKEQIGDVQGKAATLNNMAWVVAQQGDVARAMALWEESLRLDEQIGDVKSKATTLNNMAGVVAQQGDLARAMALWQECFRLQEQIGDVKGKGTTLNNMGWAAGKQGDPARERELNLEAAHALGAVRAWLDLVTVLGNLGVSGGPDAVIFLAQALWLCAHAEAPVKDVVYLSAAFVTSLTPGADIAPLVGAHAALVMETRGENHPKKEELTRLAQGMLAACAEARNVPPEGFRKWLKAERLDDPEALVPALTHALEGLVGEQEWFFDRTLLTRPS